MEPSQHNLADHDLLIKLNTTMDGLVYDVKELKDNTNKRVDTLEGEKLNTKQFEQVKAEADKLHESILKRVVWLERIAYGALGIIAFLEFYHRVLSNLSVKL